MPKFVYKAKKGPDEIVEGNIFADNQDQVIKELDMLGLIPVSIVEKDGGASQGKGSAVDQQKQKAVSNRKIKPKDIDAFTWQLASLVKASVPILRALTLITQQTENATLKAVVDDLKKKSRTARRYPRP